MHKYLFFNVLNESSVVNELIALLNKEIKTVIENNISLWNNHSKIHLKLMKHVDALVFEQYPHYSFKSEFFEINFFSIEIINKNSNLPDTSVHLGFFTNFSSYLTKSNFINYRIKKGNHIVYDINDEETTATIYENEKHTTRIAVDENDDIDIYNYGTTSGQIIKNLHSILLYLNQPHLNVMDFLSNSFELQSCEKDQLLLLDDIDYSYYKTLSIDIQQIKQYIEA